LVLAGHSQLKHELRRPSREETGARTTVFELEGIQGQHRRDITWLLEQCAASYYWVMGDPERAIASGQRALVFCGSDYQVETNLFLGQVYCTMGDYRRAKEFLRRNIALIASDRARERFGIAALPSVMSRTWLVWCLSECSEFAEGIAHAEEALQIAEAVDHPYSLIVAHFEMGLLYLRQGELHKAIWMLERGLQLCQIGNLPIRFSSIASTLGYAYALSGRTWAGSIIIRCGLRG